MFVGLIELLLEFVKPVTLSMRLFGNIYGGEVALAVLTALTIAIIPMAMIALELMLNLVQALIFATADPHVHPRGDRAATARSTTRRTIQRASRQAGRSGPVSSGAH